MVLLCTDLKKKSVTVKTAGTDSSHTDTYCCVTSLCYPICPICNSVLSCLRFRFNLLRKKIRGEKGFIQRNYPQNKISFNCLFPSLEKKKRTLEMTVKAQVEEWCKGRGNQIPVLP